MSVLLVTDDADDDIQNYSITNQQEYFYKQLKELEYDLSSLVTSFSIVESSSSIIVKSNKHYRQHRRRRRWRPQQCLVQHLLTYMLTLLILTNHLHWSVIFLSLSSIKIMSTHASTTTIVTSSNQTITTTTTIKSPSLTPSIPGKLFEDDEKQCLPLNGLHIDRICSKVCRARKTPFEKFDDLNHYLIDMHYLPFCSHHLNQTIVKENFFNETTEIECRQILTQIKTFDEEAKNASEKFASYMQAIDSASNENRYSIIDSDCQKAYEIWTCSVKIPFYYRNQLIPPCQTICDEVERVCPTFRPSDREPLFAGQPLFFCNGGIVVNSDYARPPHCFDTCHLFHGSLQRPSAWSPLLSNKSSSSSPYTSITKFVENLVTTPTCFEIKPVLPSSSEQIRSPLIFVNESISNNTNNTSLSNSAITIISSSWSSISLTFIFVLQLKFLQEL